MRPPQETASIRAELLAKYRQMRRMRLEDEAEPGADRRDQMRDLAGRWPGALREIDELPIWYIEGGVRRFNSSGLHRRKITVPPGFGPHTITYRGYALDHDGKIVTSGPETVEYR